MTVALEFSHVDVFKDKPFAGNGLIVIFGDPSAFSAEALRTVTAEMRQIESILVDSASGASSVTARIFTAEEELPFAGHPVIGAAAVLHDRHAAEQSSYGWSFQIAGGRELAVRSHQNADYYRAEMNQGQATLRPPIEPRQGNVIRTALGLDDTDLHLLPHAGGLYLLAVPDRARLGPAAAYLIAHGLAAATERIVIHQGGYVGRPSTIAVTADAEGNVWVGGPVAHGSVNLPRELHGG